MRCSPVEGLQHGKCCCGHSVGEAVDNPKDIFWPECYQVCCKEDLDVHPASDALVVTAVPVHVVDAPLEKVVGDPHDAGSRVDGNDFVVGLGPANLQGGRTVHEEHAGQQLGGAGTPGVVDEVADDLLGLVFVHHVFVVVLGRFVVFGEVFLLFSGGIGCFLGFVVVTAVWLLHVLVVDGRGSSGCFLGFVLVTAVW